MREKASLDERLDNIDQARAFQDPYMSGCRHRGPVHLSVSRGIGEKGASSARVERRKLSVPSLMPFLEATLALGKLQDRWFRWKLHGSIRTSVPELPCTSPG